MPDQVNIGFSPATAWNRIQIDADRATAAAEFKTAKAAFATAAFTLLGLELSSTKQQTSYMPDRRVVTAPAALR